MQKITMKQAINILQADDVNATWYECKTLQELKNGLLASMESYKSYDIEAYSFFENVYNSLK
jgi:hypothetical protein